MIHSISIVLSGEAGQGLQTTEELLVEAVSKFYYIFSTKDVMSRVRGGNNTVEIRLAQEPIYAYRHTIDLLFLLNDHALDRIKNRITKDTIIIGEESFVEKEFLDKINPTFIPFNLNALAKEAGHALFANTILFGFIVAMLKLNKDIGHDPISNRFSNKPQKMIDANLNAFSLGYNEGKNYSLKKSLEISKEVKHLKTLDGTTAISIGALAGGCNFIAAYPMSPATGVLTYLANKAKAYDVLVEQAEDEIAALNMVIGSWYAGARGMTTTSGGGFALMVEAVSLSGITETPCVIHIGQRPGPGTGLPTRTEQADLNLALYAGHGEFPRIIFAPGRLEDAILLSQRAFYLADKYQVPVFILSDQFLLDSIGQIKPFKLDSKYLNSFITKTSQDYKRYAFTDNNLSPRGIPGYGDGLVKVDSDEHNESGQITEDFEMRIKMNNKRLGKNNLLLEDFIQPELIGSTDYKNLIIGWGSTYGVLKEFIETKKEKDTAFLYFKQVYPLPKNIKDFFNQAEKIVVIENNATGQFANLLKLELDINVNYNILKYNGEPFSIEEIDTDLEEVL